ncbi:MAG: hypothetical protein DI622_03825 [Chryseobacterium sp.]|nr:MAG: hypothetical protein DI622_03825 [Chryseobacterium sp.]
MISLVKVFLIKLNIFCKENTDNSNLYSANKGLIVTTSYFSRDAIKKQQETPLLLEYKDKDEVINWVNEYYAQKN